MLVKFPMTEHNWNIVVNLAKESMCVESEDLESFVVEYDTEEAFHAALTRFDGLIDFEENPVKE